MQFENNNDNSHNKIFKLIIIIINIFEHYGMICLECLYFLIYASLLSHQMAIIICI